METSPRLLVLGDIFETAARALYGEDWRESVLELMQGTPVTLSDIDTWPRKGAPGWAFERLRPLLVERLKEIEQVLRAVPEAGQPPLH